MKKKLDALKMAETSPLIPTIGIKITAKGMGTTAWYVPEEGAGGVPLTAKGWGHYPLIQVCSAKEFCKEIKLTISRNWIVAPYQTLPRYGKSLGPQCGRCVDITTTIRVI